MKKTFPLTHPKHKTPRVFEAVRSDIKKYVKRERKKKLPDGMDFWDFDCKFGATEEDAAVIHLAEFGKHLTQAETDKLASCYIEILAKAAKRTKKPKEEPT